MFGRNQRFALNGRAVRAVKHLEIHCDSASITAQLLRFSVVPESMVRMRIESFGRFNAAGLYAALDAQRRARGMSWSQVAAETGVSISTLTRTKRGGRMEVDGMLAMVRWLSRTAESFTFGYEGSN